MDFGEITEVQKFWGCMEKIPINQSVCFVCLDNATVYLERYRDIFKGVGLEKMTPEGKGDIGEIKEAVESALSHANKALHELRQIEDMVDDVKGE